MPDTIWPIVPICDRQRLDVRESDLLEGGLYRKCNTYRGCGGYDQYPAIAQKRFGHAYAQQFVAQLYGCTLKCPYCYVTEEGIYGAPCKVTTLELVRAFVESEQEVFHLMGGAPGLYLPQWNRLIATLGKGTPFHSDLLLCEGVYSPKMIKSICKPNCLYAINIKGVNKTTWTANTGREGYPLRLILCNLKHIFLHGKPENFYFTFTNIKKEHAELYLDWLKSVFKHVYKLDITAFLEDYFCIDLIKYNAIGV